MSNVPSPAMMILSALMKMLLWTLPGASLPARHTTELFPYQRLRDDLTKLDINLSQPSLLGCHMVHTQNEFDSGELRFELLSEQLLRSLAVVQNPTTISSAIALAEILSQTPADADDSIRTLLHGFIRVNRVLSEGAYIVPVSALPTASKGGRDDKVLIVHSAVRTPVNDRRLTRDDESVEVNTTTALEWEQRYKKLRTIQQNLIDAANKGVLDAHRKDGPAGPEEAVLHGQKRPIAMLEQYCESVAQSDISKRYKEWRIMLGFLNSQTARVDQSTPVFYISMPLQNIDLNQCDDSPHVKIRGTHGCFNTTCVFTPGGGFEMGNYKCCCPLKNITGVSETSLTWLEQQHQHHQLMLQKQEQCFDGKMAESHRLNAGPFPQCEAYFEGDYTLRKVLLAINVISAMAAFGLIFVVMTQRKVQDWGARGWALMELFLLGAILLYSIVVLEFLYPQTSTCCLILWCRELGFALFYGSVVLKIHRNLFEHRVRKAHHVYIKEKDLLKYLLCVVAFTVIGLVAWTVTAIQAAQTTQPPRTNGAAMMTSVALLSRGITHSGNPYIICAFFHWNIVWHAIESGFLAYGAYLSYKARNTTWNERRQFAVAVFLEMAISTVTLITKKNIWLHSSPDTLLLLSFIHVHLTVTVILVLIMATKFYYASLDPNVRAQAVVSSGPNKPHPSLAKLRDNLVNGTVDFAEVPIAEMNPEDIRAELKRVYTQLRMYKLTNLYMENPHISKRKGGKKTSNKQTNRRFSIPTVPNKAYNKELKRLEADERSSLAKGTDDDKDSLGSAADLTIQSSPHNVYLSRTALAAAKKLQLDSDLSVRI